MASNPGAGSGHMPPPGFGVEGMLSSLVLSHTFLTLIFPLVLSLFYFTTPQGRRRPIFLLILVAIALGMTEVILVDVAAIHNILEPQNEMAPAISTVMGFLRVVQSIFVDLILLVRLVSIYPPRHLGSMRFAFLVATPSLVVLTRIANIVAFTVAVVRASDGPNPALQSALVFEKAPYLKIELASQMANNMYLSVAFLWRLRHRVTQPVLTNSSIASLAERMRSLFRMALASFIVPTAFSVAQFVCLYQGVNTIVLNQIALVNAMLATFFVAFATIWAGSINHQPGTKLLDSKRDNVAGSLAHKTETESGQSLQLSSA